MNTGALRHRVTLDTPAGAAGYTPLVPPDWDCAVLNIGSGTDSFIGRYHAGITTATRLHFKGRIYHVIAIANRGERDLELELTCREVFD